MQIRQNGKNFGTVFQYGGEIHFGSQVTDFILREKKIAKYFASAGLSRYDSIGTEMCAVGQLEPVERERSPPFPHLVKNKFREESSRSVSLHGDSACSSTIKP